MHRYLLVAIALTMACVGASRPGATSASRLEAPQDASAVAHCDAVADSVRASTPAERLAIAQPIGRPQIPIPRGTMGVEVRTTFLVDPNGFALPGSIRTTGAELGFQAEMEKAVLRMRFRAPVVAGCRVWSRGDLRLRSEVRRM